MYTKEEIAQNIRDCAQSLMDNAENIAYSYEFLRNDIVITCYPSEENEAPYIKVSTSFVPDNFIKRYT